MGRPKKIKKEPVIERRKLRCDLTDKEMQSFSIQLAAENRNHAALEDEKKAVGSSYKAKIDESVARINNLATLVGNGFDMRDVDCEVTYHWPEKGKKTMTRMDTKATWTEPMTDDEWNLFNQPPDDVEGEFEEVDSQLSLGNG